MVLDHSIGIVHCICISPIVFERSKLLYKLDSPHCHFHSWTLGDSERSFLLGIKNLLCTVDTERGGVNQCRPVFTLL